MYNLFFFQVVLIFVPGIITAIANAVHGAGKWPSFSFFIVQSFVFGIIIYLMLGFVYFIAGVEYDIFNFVQDERIAFETFYDEILWTIPILVLFISGWLAIQSRNWITRFLNFCRITKSIGRLNVWTNTLNSPEPEFEFIRVVDFKKMLMYEGWVKSYSQYEDTREILLKTVAIYDLNSDLLRRISYLYVSHHKDDIWIEFPHDPENEGEKND